MSHDADYLGCDIYIVYSLVGAVITKSVEWLRCGLEQPRFLSWQGYETFLLQKTSGLIPWFIQPYIQRIWKDISPGVKRSVWENGYSPLSTGEV